MTAVITLSRDWIQRANKWEKEMIVILDTLCCMLHGHTIEGVSDSN